MSLKPGRQKSDLQLKLCLKMQGKQHWEKENTPLMMMFSDRRIDHEETDQREKSAFPSSGFEVSEIVVINHTLTKRNNFD